MTRHLELDPSSAQGRLRKLVPRVDHRHRLQLRAAWWSTRGYRARRPSCSTRRSCAASAAASPKPVLLNPVRRRARPRGAAPLPRPVGAEPRPTRIHILATAAAREAKNGPSFVREAERILGTKVHVLSGREEALLRGSLGIVCGVHGGRGAWSATWAAAPSSSPPSTARRSSRGRTVPLGGLRLADDSGRVPGRRRAASPRKPPGRTRSILTQPAKARHLLRRRRHVARLRPAAHAAAATTRSTSCTSTRSSADGRPSAHRPTIVSADDGEALGGMEAISPNRQQAAAVRRRWCWTR